VSAGDFVGSLPVGMQSRGDTDLPYWSSQNMYVYKEVWVHSTSRWLWLMEDLLGRPPSPAAVDFDLSASTAANGEITLRVTARGEGQHTYTLRSDNLVVGDSVRRGGKGTIEWKARPKSDAIWTAVVFSDGRIAQRRDVIKR
jgi:hypothetical protein